MKDEVVAFLLANIISIILNVVSAIIIAIGGILATYDPDAFQLIWYGAGVLIAAQVVSIIISYSDSKKIKARLEMLENRVTNIENDSVRR